MRTIWPRGILGAVLVYCATAIANRGLSENVTPADWPKQCRWPDRVLEDGRKVNLRPLFDWLAGQQKQLQKMFDERGRKVEMSERELKIQQAKDKPNPMPLWVLVSKCKSYSTSNNVAVAVQTYSEVLGRRRLRQGGSASVGGFVGGGGTRDASIPILGDAERPIVILNHPDSSKWTSQVEIAPFYALKSGQQEIEWAGEKLTVDVYDHGKTATPINPLETRR